MADDLANYGLFHVLELLAGELLAVKDTHLNEVHKQVNPDSPCRLLPASFLPPSRVRLGTPPPLRQLEGGPKPGPATCSSQSRRNRRPTPCATRASAP
jgi:hypothetical protein